MRIIKHSTMYAADHYAYYYVSYANNYAYVYVEYHTIQMNSIGIIMLNMKYNMRIIKPIVCPLCILLCKLSYLSCISKYRLACPM